MKDPRAERATLARIVRPHGLRGEVAAEILTDFPRHLLTLSRVYLWDGLETLREDAVRSCRLTPHRGGQALFQFAGTNTIEEARALIGWQVQVPNEERARLEAGQYYVTDLEGCTVRDEKGALLGEVAGVQSTGETVSGTPVLIVRGAKGELLLPLAAEICVSIDTAAREIVVRPPEGLCELNEP